MNRILTNVDALAPRADAEDGALAPVMYHYHPGLTLERGEGSWLYDTSGRRIYDLTSGIAVAVLGHAHPEVVAAVRAQAGRIMHICGAVADIDVTARYAKELTAGTPAGLDTVFLTNSGAEAVEGALKLASFTTRRPAYVAFRGSFHGRTYGATSVTFNKDLYRHGYEPLRPSVYSLPFPTSEAEAGPAWQAALDLFDSAVDPEDVAAVIIEPIQGEGGYYPAPSWFLEALRSYTAHHGITLIFDEVQSGFGRTGALFACQRYGITPDVLVLAKSIANGMPLAAVVSTRERMGRWEPGAHGSTFGGNPVSCAAASATLRVIQRDGLAERASALGEEMVHALLRAGMHEGHVRAFGAMVAVTCESPEQAKRVIHGALAEDGILLLTCGRHGESIRFMPALTASPDELTDAVYKVGRRISATR